ncbi:MAG: amidohydrolase [Burkholderiales bacterium RIFCSPHIGHO2_12_FULL_61_11]|nr:MAG: amidohydrolase [Burkholderiales bacterium RIFCSPHIGHO2_12_FULL_61_11]
MSTPPPRAYKRIATEEAWATPELIQHYVKILETRSINDPGFYSLWGFFGKSQTPRARDLFERVQDLGERRLSDMDATGIDMQLLLLTAPGVQVFDAATATALAISTNDQLTATIRQHPSRYAGLAAVAPQAPQAAAKELERSVNQLGLKGVVINSHTQGEYLDDEKFWDIFAAAEALDVPVYIHPNTPSPQMIAPFLSRCLDAGIYGFAAETGLHALRLIVSGVFDRFPKLKVVLGHLGEGLPYWLYRIDFMHAGIVRSNRSEGVKPLKKKPSDYLRENFYYTTSGMPWEPSISFVQKLMGHDRVMYAMDYPYQYVAEEVTAMDNLPLSAEQKKMFFQTNAETLFKL